MNRTRLPNEEVEVSDAAVSRVNEILHAPQKKKRAYSKPKVTSGGYMSQEDLDKLYMLMEQKDEARRDLDNAAREFENCCDALTQYLQSLVAK